MSAANFNADRNPTESLHLISDLRNQTIKSEGGKKGMPFDLDKKLEELTSKLIVAKRTGRPKEVQQRLQDRIEKLKQAQKINQVIQTFNEQIDKIIGEIQIKKMIDKIM